MNSPIKLPNKIDQSQQKLENINQYIKSIVQASELPKNSELKNKVKNEVMFQVIKNIYQVPESRPYKASSSATAEYKKRTL